MAMYERVIDLVSVVKATSQIPFLDQKLSRTCVASRLRERRCRCRYASLISLDLIPIRAHRRGIGVDRQQTQTASVPFSAIAKLDADLQECELRSRSRVYACRE